MICRLRYRLLEAGTTVRNVTACLAILMGSYIASTFANASPPTHSRIEAPRPRTVIVAPPVDAVIDVIPEVERHPRQHSGQLQTL